MDIMKPAADVFRENLKRIMERDGWTMYALAEAVGTSRPGISRILSGADGVTLERAERIALAVGEPLWAMLGEREWPLEKKSKTPA